MGISYLGFTSLATSTQMCLNQPRLIGRLLEAAPSRMTCGAKPLGQTGRIAMIAYLILVHRYPEQFKRMFRAIYEPGNQYLIHVDQSSGEPLAHDIAHFLQSYQGAEVLESRKALWGGYSLVDAELRGMKRLLEMSESWTHYINLSGQDFPLKTQYHIRDFLAANPGRQFIRALDQADRRPDTMNRVSHRFVEGRGTIARTDVARAYLSRARPWIGTQWKVVDRAFCQFVCTSQEVGRFKRFYRGTLIPDEGFFQSVMMNTGPHGQVMNDDLRMIDWVPDGDIKLRPRTFTVADRNQLFASTDLFARKFDSSEDADILTLLENHLTSPRSFAPRITASIARPRPVPLPALAGFPFDQRTTAQPQVTS